MTVPLRLELSLDETGTATARRIAAYLAEEGAAEGLAAAGGIGLRVHLLANDSADREPRFTGDESFAMTRVAPGKFEIELSVERPERFQYRYLALYDAPLYRRIGRTDRHVFSLIGVSELEPPMPTSFGNRVLPRDFGGGTVRDRFGAPTFPSAKGPCAYPFRSLVIGADGRVTVCCVDDRFRLAVGDIARDDYAAVTGGEPLRALKRAHAEGRSDRTPANPEGIPLCLLCQSWPTPRLSAEALAAEPGFAAEAAAMAGRVDPRDPDRCDAMRPYLTVEVSSRCDLACGHCSQKNAALDDPRDLDPAAFERFLESARRAGASFENANLFFRGESLLHPEFARFPRAVEGSGLFRFLVLHTNGQRLAGEAAEALLDAWSQRIMPCCGNLFVSLDAARDETYRALRGGELARAEENIRAFVRRRTERGQFGPNLVLQFIVLPGNAAEAGEFVAKWRAFLAAEGAKPCRVAATLADQPARIDSDIVYLRRARTPGEGPQAARDDAARDLYLRTVAALGLPLDEGEPA